jgi:hypothetical protein
MNAATTSHQRAANTTARTSDPLAMLYDEVISHRAYCEMAGIPIPSIELKLDIQNVRGRTVYAAVVVVNRDAKAWGLSQSIETALRDCRMAFALWAGNVESVRGDATPMGEMASGETEVDQCRR